MSYPKGKGMNEGAKIVVRSRMSLLGEDPISTSKRSKKKLKGRTKSSRKAKQRIGGDDHDELRMPTTKGRKNVHSKGVVLQPTLPYGQTVLMSMQDTADRLGASLVTGTDCQEKIERLLNLIPPLPHVEEVKKLKPTLFSTVFRRSPATDASNDTSKIELDTGAQYSLLALAHYLHAGGTVQVADILTVLLRTLHTLPLLVAAGSTSTHSQTESFAYAFTLRLAKLGASAGEQNIISSIVEVMLMCDGAHTGNAQEALWGLTMAISDKDFPVEFLESDLPSVVDLFTSLLSKSRIQLLSSYPFRSSADLTVLVLRALESLAQMDERAITVQRINNMFLAGIEVLQQAMVTQPKTKGMEQSISSTLYNPGQLPVAPLVAAIELITTCASVPSANKHEEFLAIISEVLSKASQKLPTPKGRRLCLAVMDALSDLALVYPNVVPKYLSHLEAMALAIYHSMSDGEVELAEVCEDVSDTIASLFEAHVGDSSEYELVSMDLSSLCSKVHSYIGGDNDSIAGHLIRLLGKIACTSQSQMVVDHILPVFMDIFAGKSGSHVGIISSRELVVQMSRIVLLEQELPYRNIVDLFVRSYTNSSTSKKLLEIIPLAFRDIGANLTDSALLEDFVVRMLKLFQNEAVRVQEHTFTKGAPQTPEYHYTSAAPLGRLLPAVSESLSRISPSELQKGSSITKLCQQVWHYCVLHNLPKGSNEAWASSVSDLALVMPLLLRRKTHNLVEEVYEADAIVSHGVSEKRLSEMRTWLSSELPSSAHSSVNKLSKGQLLYLLAMASLETIRALGSADCKSIFQYLEEVPSSDKTPMAECLRSVSSSVIHAYVSSMRATALTAERQTSLQDQVQFLLVQVCDSRHHTRQSAEKYLGSVLKAFSQLYWNDQCLSTMFDILEGLGMGCEDSTFAESIALPSCPYALDLPDGLQARETILQNFTRVCTVWLKSAFALAPAESHSSLHGYLQSFQRLSLGFLHHIGFSVILDVAAMTKVNVGALGATTTLDSKAAGFVASLELKSHHSGEISGMKHLLLNILPQQEVSLPPGLSTNVLAHHLYLQFQEYLRLHKSGHKVNIKEFNAAMYRAAAILASDDNVEEDFIHIICWYPAYIFTPESMRSAVFAWNWVLSALKDHEIRFLTEMAAAWSWTIDEKIGLFSGVSSIKETFASLNSTDAASSGWNSIISAPGRDDPSSKYQDVSAHRLWVLWLSERYDAYKRRVDSSVQMSIILRMVNKALDNPQDLTTTPSSLGARFRLLLLGLKLLKFCSTSKSAVVLRDRVFSCSLAWFANIGSWDEPSSAKVVKEDLDVLVEFCKVLRSSTSLQQPSKHQKGDNHEAHGGGHMSSSASDAGGMDSSEMQSRVEMRTARSDSSKGIGSSNIDMISSEQLELLLLLVGNEIDRIYAWINPLNKPQLKVNDVDMFTSDRKIGVAQWKQYVKTAWIVAPKLAVFFALRFKNATVSAELKALIQANPIAVVDVPEALKFFVTEETIEKQPQLLKHLLYWSPGSLPMAIGFLSHRYSRSPLVKLYAVRLLRLFAPPVVMFVLPQLIQALRHDSEGIIEDYLFYAAKSDALLAHQIVWLLRTASAPAESVDHKRQGFKEEARDPLEPIVIALLERIVKSFTHDEKMFYDDEFDFFEKVNAISGKMRPVPPHKRVQAMVEELKKIPVKGRALYLPSNPEMRVHAINLENPMVMQSAKKFPIMVSFLVSKEKVGPELIGMLGNGGDDEEDDHINVGKASSESLQRPTITRRLQSIARLPVPQSPSLARLPSSKEQGKGEGEQTESDKRWQACIFKVDDDCRQDVLALQVIRLFKDIFEDCGLELYLFPYRVVCTKPACGILEVVPNAKSRDQVGKAVEGGLYEHFVNKYGNPDGKKFARARRNFILSMAAYSVVSFILQIKDRHNGNILVDDLGHVIHIDFGFVFDISPGGNFKFESAPFKLTREMIQIMGESRDAEPFKLFQELVVKGFLAARQHMDSVIALVELMLDSGLHCFTPNSIKNLRNRFAPNMTDRAAAAWMISLTKDSYANVKTTIYDGFQHIANDIEF